MPYRHQHSVAKSPLQGGCDPEQCWNDLVQQHLPATLDAQARTLGAFQRARIVKSPRHFLRGLLCYVLSMSSLKQLSGWGRIAEVTNVVMSPQAWHQRIQKSGPWLFWLLQTLLGTLMSTTSLPTAQRIVIADATRLTEMGPKGDSWCLHCAYDLLANHLAWLRVSNHHVGERFDHLPIDPNDILVADGAYSRAGQLMAVDEAKAFSLTRLSPQHLPVYAHQALAETAEFRLDVPGWLAHLPIGAFERPATVFHEGKRLEVRLIAVVLPPEKAAALRRKKQREARHKGRLLSEQALLLAGFHLLVTTLPEGTWPLEVLLELYRCRWQIEMLFKRIKEVLDVHRLRCECAQTAQAMIAALLVAWLLIECQAAQLRREITNAEPFEIPVSSWQLDRWAHSGLQKVVEGWWSPGRVLELAPELRRLFRDRRRRPLQEHAYRVRFLGVLLPLSDARSFFDCSGA